METYLRVQEPSLFQSFNLVIHMADNLTYFEDLLEESSLQSSLAILEKDYDEAIYVKGIIDERLFVNDEDSLLGSGSLSGNAIHICGTKVSLCSQAKDKRSYNLFHYCKSLISYLNLSFNSGDLMKLHLQLRQ